MLPTRLTLALRTHIKQSVVMKKDIPWKWKPKGSKSKFTYFSETDFKSNTVTRDKESYYMIKGSIHLEDIPTVNIYATNNGVLKYIKQTLTDLRVLSVTINNSSIIEKNQYPLSTMDRSAR